MKTPVVGESYVRGNEPFKTIDGLKRGLWFDTNSDRTQHDRPDQKHKHFITLNLVTIFFCGDSTHHACPIFLLASKIQRNNQYHAILRGLCFEAAITKWRVEYLTTSRHIQKKSINESDA